MRIKMPSVKIKGDRSDKIIARSGDIVGLTKSRIIWRFGFLPDSDLAKAFGVQTKEFHWVLTDKAGNVLSEHYGFGASLPKRFNEVIEGKL